MFDAIAIVKEIYPEDNEFRRRLLQHSAQVRDKAFEILAAMGASAPPVDIALIEDGCFLHDIGCGDCRAPEIGCKGMQPYVSHGVLGAKILRNYGNVHGIDMEPYARICERHISCGLTASLIKHKTLLIPARDYLPETIEEKLICLANKFFSRSGDLHEKSIIEVRRYIHSHGEECILRFDALCDMFSVSQHIDVSTDGFDGYWNEFRDLYWQRIVSIAKMENVLQKTERLNILLHDVRSYWTSNDTPGGRWLNDFVIYDPERGLPLRKYLCEDMALQGVQRIPDKQDIHYVIVPFMAVFIVFFALKMLGLYDFLCYIGGAAASLCFYRPVHNHDLKVQAIHRQQEMDLFAKSFEQAHWHCCELLEISCPSDYIGMNHQALYK